MNSIRLVPLLMPLASLVCLAPLETPARAQEPLSLQLQTGHSGGVAALLLSSDGQTLWSAGMDCTIRRWNVGSGNETARIYNGWKGARAWALSPNGSMLAVGYDDGSVRLYQSSDPTKAPRLLDFAKDKATALAITALAFSGDGTLLSVVGSDPQAVAQGSTQNGVTPPNVSNRVRTWKAKDLTVAGGFELKAPAIIQLVFAWAGDSIYTGNLAAQVKEYSLTGDPQDSCQLPRNGVLSPDICALSSDGALVLGDTFAFYETHHGALKGKLTTSQMRPGRLTFGAFSSDSKLIVGATDILRAWAGSGGKEKYAVFLRNDPPQSFALSADGTTVATGHNSSAINVREAPTGKLTSTIPGGPELWEGLSWYGSDVAAPVGGRVARLNGTTGKFEKDWTFPAEAVTALATSPDGNYIAMALYGVPTPPLPVVAADGKTTIPAPPPPPPPPPPPAAAGDAGDGGEPGGPGAPADAPPPSRAEVRVMDARTGAVVWAHPDTVDGWAVKNLFFSPDSSALVCGGEKVDPAAKAESGFAGINALDSVTGDKADLFFVQGSHIGNLGTMTISQGGTRVVASDDKNVYAWELPSGKSVLNVPAPGLEDGQTAVSPDGHWLAAVTPGGWSLWDISEAKGNDPVHHFETATTVTGVAFTAKGDLEASDSVGDLLFWTNDQLAAGGQFQKTPGDGFAIANLKASPDGRLVAGTGLNGRLRIFDGNGHLKLTAARLGQDDTGPWISFTPAGKFTGTAEAELLIRWKQGGKILPGDTYLEKMRSADEVAAALAP